MTLGGNIMMKIFVKMLTIFETLPDTIIEIDFYYLIRWQ